MPNLLFRSLLPVALTGKAADTFIAKTRTTIRNFVETCDDLDVCRNHIKAIVEDDQYRELSLTMYRQLLWFSIGLLAGKFDSYDINHDGTI